MPSSADVKKLILDKAPIEQIYAKANLLKPLELVLLKAEGGDEVQKIMNSPEFVPLWVNKFNALRLTRDPSFRFRDPAPQSKADFYCGYVLYLAALNVKRTDEDKYSYYLSAALRFNSFHAFQECLHSLVHLGQNYSTKKELNDAVSYLSSVALQIPSKNTPSSLLLANTWFYFASFYSKLGCEGEAVECYKKCWANLHLAELTESNSEKAIHNAYFGEGIKLSNAYGLNTLTDIKERCLTVANGALTAQVRNSIEADLVDKLTPECKEISEEKSIRNKLSIL
ncbi:Dot/Icm T4SS effector metaeffector MesI [Legionella sp. km772]|uniref:Dot/Icm T4SS effector metaeffector MesI n=1 Tax=Legionella sp. km772 TaxID=2498111 RepID=UPI000F8C6876|nr:Dot/Icm T4SS effector metaeffector MesI [Legionella sp. km772]RUR06902.1 hypothetical protein ELY15_12720 [Legionella sp. km772]